MARLRARFRSSGFLGGLGVAIILGAWANPCFAESSSGWLETYEAEPTCPTPSTFRSMVLRRLPGRRPLALDRLRVEVQISREPGGVSWRGRVSGRADGVRFSREMADTSCDALVHALSLVVALEADDAFAGEPADAPDGWGSDPSELSEPARDPDSKPRSFDAREHGSLNVAPLVRGAVQSGLAPGLAIGLGAGVALQWRYEGLWQPRLELSAMTLDAPSTALPTVAGQLEMSALLVNARFCPLELADSHWSLRPCFELDVGRLTAAGSGASVIRTQERHAPWVSSGLSLEAGVSPWHGPVQLSASFGTVAALARHEFYFAPDIEAFDVPTAGWRAATALAVTF